jgi:hypothetical protein
MKNHPNTCVKTLTSNKAICISNYNNNNNNKTKKKKTKKKKKGKEKEKKKLGGSIIAIKEFILYLYVANSTISG